ncbi:MAG TPA: class I SAM-dependent methyltransferase, partial [Burkholderiaceae bacterium]|nr:class I SAM-dependent methyltransferase [Burkholderiaceae bacterium]
MHGTASFYGSLTPLFHLVYPDWEASVHKQARDLDSLIREFWGDGCRRVSDVACGIGTQTLGLAQLGYQVAGSDLCAEAIDRA